MSCQGLAEPPAANSAPIRRMYWPPCGGFRSIESVGETLRATLNALAELDASWLLSVVTQEWFDRSVHRVELARLPKAETKREAWVKQLGQDVFSLLAMGQRQETPTPIRQAACWSLLAQVWQQHYEVVDQQVRWRQEPAASSEQRVVSPYDPEARCSRKREISWLGGTRAFD